MFSDSDTVPILDPFIRKINSDANILFCFKKNIFESRYPRDLLSTY